MPLSLRYTAHSEIGLVRKNNQDSAYVSPSMLMVADGMGGAAAGDLASAVTVRELKAVDHPASGEEMLTTLGRAVERAGAAMNEMIDADPTLAGMGSTACGVMFDGEHFALLNIGDSRAYRLREGDLTRLTHDHSWVQALVDQGRITEEEALEHPHRSLILKVINGQPEHTPDLQLADIRLGDRLLICSDGLCGLVTDEAIAAHLDGDPQAVLVELVELAHEAGGSDNITVIVADVVAAEPTGQTRLLGAAERIDPDSLENTAEVPILLTSPPPPTAATKEALRYRPVTRRRPLTWLKVVLAVLVPLALIGAGGTTWYLYTQQQHYLGTAGEFVAIYQGIPEPVFNLPLSKVVSVSAVRTVDLPRYYADRVQATIPVGSLDAAHEMLATLQVKADQCIAQRNPPLPPTPPTTSPPTTPGATPNPSVTPQTTPAPPTTPGADEDLEC